jgi:hypothetical protein
MTIPNNDDTLIFVRESFQPLDSLTVDRLFPHLLISVR